MRTFAFLLLALASTSFALAAEPVVGGVVPVPAPKADPWTELKCEVGAPTVLSAGEAKAVTWRLIDESAASLTTVPGSTSAVFFALRPGRYRFAAIADGKPEWCSMTVGDVPLPPPPGPPPTPKPVDELTKQLIAAYAENASPTKAADLRQLIAIYLECAKAAHDVRFRTAGALFQAVSETAAELLPDDVTTGRRLPGVRKIIAGELAAVLPTDQDAALTEAQRVSASAAFARFAKALQGVQP